VKGSALVTRQQSSPNHEPRLNGVKPSFIVLHYTGMASGPAAVDWLCNPVSKVSCHYLVDVDGSIVQMVDEDLRAWHAGVSSWYGTVDINSASIGIEIQNQGHSCGLPHFPIVQMKAVAMLSLDIMVRHGFSPDYVVAHSDIAPGRKVDPGEAFDWDYLAAHGVGQMIRPTLRSASDVAVAEYQVVLSAIGYGLDINGIYDNRTRIVLEAVQRRYRRNLVNGIADAETVDILRRLKATLPNTNSA
jgi:N-acetylmuramoyl-L-alanine amidase